MSARRILLMMAALVALVPATAGAAGTTRGVLGVASVGGERLVGAKVTIHARSGGWFTRKLAATGMTTTNAAGGFAIEGGSLPPEYLVKVSGGNVRGSRFKGTLQAVGRRSENGVTVTPITTIAALYLKAHPKTGSAKGIARIRRLFGVPKLPGGIATLGEATSVPSSRFAPAVFMAAAKRHGGLAKYVRALARRARRSKATVTHAPPPRTTLRAEATPAPEAGFNPVTIAMESVVWNATQTLACKVPVPGVHSMMGCGGTDQLDQIIDSLNAIETSLVDIQAQLDEVSQQLTLITNQNAQAAYQHAYDFAGINPVSNIVNAAWSDANYLAAAYPNPAPPSTPASNSDADLCNAAYPRGYVNGQDLQGLCLDFLTRVEAFISPQTPYYATMYQALTGAGSQPANNLLAWTYQNLIDGSGQQAVTGAAVQEMEQTLDQVAQLQANAFTLLIAGLEFKAYMTGGSQIACPDVTTTGTFPSNTALNVVGVCNTMQTALFELSAERYLADQSWAVPPAGSVVDPRTNRVWWGYPVDLTVSTTATGTFPFYSGGPATVSPAPSITALAAGPVPILAADPSHTFRLAQQTDLVQLFASTPLPSGGKVADALNNAGFTGVGSTAGGMTWKQLATDPAAVQYTAATIWKATANNQYVGWSCPYSKYPSIAGTLTCTWLGIVTMGQNVGPAVQVNGGLAGHFFDTTATKLPTSSTTPSTCPGIYSSSTNDATHINSGDSKSWAKLCVNSTFGLLVDTAAPAPGTSNGVRPPLWSQNQLVGPPAGTIPAFAIPPPPSS